MNDNANKVSPRFCATDSDVTLRSCDGVLFQVHRRNLEVHSEGFAGGQAFSTQSEVVDLTETAEVLDLLLQYIYPQPPPNLATVNIKLLLGLAEAAEKYFFHVVIQTCKLYIKELITKYPCEILQYASRHGHRDLMDPAAEGVLKADTSQFGSKPCEIPGWFHYSNSWSQAMREIYSFKEPLHHRGKRGSGSFVSCDTWPSIYALIASRIGGQAGALLDITTVFADMDDVIGECATCCTNLEHWETKAKLVAAHVQRVPLSFYTMGPATR